MYRQGLGDCFLLTLFDAEENRFDMLIDCGVITGTDDPQEKMTEVANNILEETNSKIDVVVITHEHWDHVSGFKQARETFDKMKFGDVWMAWTEDPKNDFANGLRKAREERKKGIGLALTKMNLELANNQFLTAKQKDSRDRYLKAVEQINSFNGAMGVNGITTTKEAMDYVRTKINSEPYYCSPDKAPFVIDNIEGLRFHILGPPEDEKLIKMDLSKKEVYQKPFNSELGNSFLSAMQLQDDKQSGDNYLPFDTSSGLKIDDTNITSIFPDYFDPEYKWRQIDSDWMDFSGQLSLALDNDTNNTSLVFAIELVDTKKFLLFPGDAQAGNWLSWQKYNVNVKDKEGKAEKIDINTIFENTIFYKVGHHGSHNATLKEKGLELMTDTTLAAMIPVDRSIADKKGWNMPFPSLYDRLKEKTSGRLIIADEDIDNKTEKPPNISKSEWTRFIKDVSSDSTQLFTDYVIHC